MGIRFACHHCSHAIHVKDFQGGKRGKCPACKGSFRIPFENSTYSLVVEEELVSPTAAQSLQAVKATRSDFEQSGAPVVAKKPADSPLVSGRLKSPEKDSVERSAGVSLAHDKSPVQPSAVSAKLPEQLRPKCRAFAVAPGAQWFVRPPSGGQYGPADDALLTQWIEESRVTPESLLWREGQSHWMTARELLPELYESSSAVAPVPSISKPSSIGVTIRDAAVGKEGEVAYAIPAVVPIAASRGGKENSLDLRTSDASTPLGESQEGVTARSSALLAQRKAKRRKQQWFAIVALGIISILLLVGLVAVLLLR